MHKTKVHGGEKVESIPAYLTELVDLNKEIEAWHKWIGSIRKEEEERLLPNADAENDKGSSNFVKKTSSLLEKFKVNRD
jgi:hypothetical protein